MISLHSHSGQFCHHAKGTLEEIVQAAISRGFKTYGLSEHAPRFRVQDLYPEESHLGANDLSDLFDRYVSEAVRLKGAYRDQITLLVGAEVEYINDEHLQQTKATLEKHKDSLEYIVGSVHHCGEKWIDFDKAHFDECLDSYPGEDWDDKYNKLLEEYFDNQYNLIDKLRPQIIGHFDLCRLYYPNVSFRDRPNVWTKVERNVQLAISYGALFEVNAAAFRKGWSTAYPAPEIMDVRQFPFPGTV